MDKIEEQDTSIENGLKLAAVIIALLLVAQYFNKKK